MPGKSGSMEDGPKQNPLTTMRNVVVALAAGLFALFIQRLWSSETKYQTSILSELGPHLSPNARIILPDDPTFANATRRWTEYQAPNFGAVVVVVDERDVQQTVRTQQERQLKGLGLMTSQVKYANEHNIPFLATSGKHGDFSTLQQLKNGIQIELKTLHKVEISPKGDSVRIGGGAKTKAIVDALTAAGKRSVTGACECVSIGGVMLGGGHGFLQGQYGLLADQIIDVRLVLANGTVVVVSADSHPDMFWALKGAGHNFGIVTEVNLKAYELRGHENWAYETFTFSGDQLEAFFTAVNTISQTQPAEAVHLGLMMRVPAIDPVNPLVMWTVLYDGPPALEKAHAAPLHGIGPLAVDSGQISYLDMPKIFGADINAPGCQPGFTLMRFPIDFKAYSVQAMRQVYDLFNQKMQDTPAFNNSMFALESYSVQGVQAVPSESTAIAHRDDDVFISPFIVYLPDPSLDAEARVWGEQMRRIVHEGSGRAEMHTYINYAHGSESLENLYGYEPWRLEKLRRLKSQYDPKGRFSHFAPIR